MSVHEKATPRPWKVSALTKWPWHISIEPDIASMDRAAYGSRDNTIEDVRSGNSFRGEQRAEAVRLVAEQEANAALIVEAVNAYDILRAENERLRSALTPSSETKALLIGEFWEDIDVPNPDYDEDDEDSDEGEWIAQRVPVQWTTIKAIMEKLRRAALSEAQP